MSIQTACMSAFWRTDKVSLGRIDFVNLGRTDGVSFKRTDKVGLENKKGGV